MYMQQLQHNLCVVEALYSILVPQCTWMQWDHLWEQQDREQFDRATELRSNVSDCSYICISRCAHAVLSRDLFGSGHTGFLRGRTDSTERRTIPQSLFTPPSQCALSTQFLKLMWFVTCQELISKHLTGLIPKKPWCDKFKQDWNKISSL